MTTRRALLHTLTPLVALLALPGCGSLIGPDEVLISQAQLQGALSRQLPQHFSAGFLELDARLGRLQLLPQENRLAVGVEFDTSGPLLPRPYTGRFDLVFGVRYEPSDHTLRATQMQARAFELPGAPAGVSNGLERALPLIARVLVGEDLVLHRLSARQGERLARIGRRPDQIRVTPEGLLVSLVSSGTP